MTLGLCVGIGVPFVTQPSQGVNSPSPPPNVTINLNDSGGEVSGDDFTVQTDHAGSFIANGIELMAAGNAIRNWGINVFLKDLARTVLGGKRYRFIFRRKFINETDNAINDAFATIDDLLRGLSFGFVFNKTIASLNVDTSNDLGYPLARGASNIIIAAKLGRRAGNRSSKAIGWSYGALPTEYSLTSTSSGADTSDETIEVRIQPNGLLWDVILLVGGVSQLILNTGIAIATTTSFVPFIHLNAWGASNTTTEQFTGCNLITEDI